MELSIGSYLVLIDGEDSEKINKYRWHYNASQTGGPYFRGWIKTEFGKRIHVYLHRYIVNAPPDKHVDHINCNTLDNRKENLRLCLQIENMHNCKKSKANSTGYKGVTYNKRERKYKAQICINWHHVSLGTYSDPREAYEAYCKAALKYHGEYARLE
jgi:hypothetical protein